MALVYPKPESLYHSLVLLEFGMAFQELDKAYNNLEKISHFGEGETYDVVGDIVYARKLAEEAYLLLTTNELFNLRVVLMDLEDAYDSIMKNYDMLEDRLLVDQDYQLRSIYKYSFICAEAYRVVLDTWIELVNKQTIQPIAFPAEDSL